MMGAVLIFFLFILVPVVASHVSERDAKRRAKMDADARARGNHCAWVRVGCQTETPFADSIGFGNRFYVEIED